MPQGFYLTTIKIFATIFLISYQNKTLPEIKQKARLDKFRGVFFMAHFLARAEFAIARA